MKNIFFFFVSKNPSMSLFHGISVLSLANGMDFVAFLKQIVSISGVETGLLLDERTLDLLGYLIAPKCPARTLNTSSSLS